MEDPFVICPFYRNHKIMISRLKAHLLKCAKNHPMTGKTICPYNSQHIVDATKILDHCHVCPDIGTVLLQANIRENTNPFAYTISAIQNPGYDPTAGIKDENAHSVNDESKSNSEELRHGESISVKTKSSTSQLRRPYAKSISKSTSTSGILHAEKSEIQESNMKPSQVITKSEITSEKSQIDSKIERHENRNINRMINRQQKKVIEDTDFSVSQDINSILCDQLKSWTFDDVDYGKVYRQLEALDEQEIIIEKQRQNIKEQKKKLIGILKIIADQALNVNRKINTNVNNNHDVLNAIPASRSYDFNDKRNEQSENDSVQKFATESKYAHGVSSSFSPLTSLLPTPGVSGNGNGTSQSGRGIMNAYNKKKVSPNFWTQSQNYYVAKGSSYGNINN